MKSRSVFCLSFVLGDRTQEKNYFVLLIIIILECFSVVAHGWADSFSYVQGDVLPRERGEEDPSGVVQRLKIDVAVRDAQIEKLERSLLMLVSETNQVLYAVVVTTEGGTHGFGTKTHTLARLGLQPALARSSG